MHVLDHFGLDLDLIKKLFRKFSVGFDRFVFCFFLFWRILIGVFVGIGVVVVCGVDWVNPKGGKY